MGHQRRIGPSVRDRRNAFRTWHLDSRSHSSSSPNEISAIGQFLFISRIRYATHSRQLSPTAKWQLQAPCTVKQSAEKETQTSLSCKSYIIIIETYHIKLTWSMLAMISLRLLNIDNEREKERDMIMITYSL